MPANDINPTLKIRSPDGAQSEHPIVKDRLTIGRLPDLNDVALEPDPDRLVTRKVHCSIKRDAGRWWIVDSEGVNPTLVCRGDSMEEVSRRAALADGDVILIRGGRDDLEQPQYWELTFLDPFGTQQAGGVRRPMCLEYDPVQASLFRVEGSHREEIRNLEPQEHKLIRYMDKRNRDEGNVPVMCPNEDLIELLWPDPEKTVGTQQSLNTVVHRLRKKIETEGEEPRFLVTVPRMGYKLVTNSPPQP